MRVKCRLPKAACPATPGRKPCLISSACRSCAPSAIRAGGKQTSSLRTAVPSGRSLPTIPSRPSRIRQSISIASASRVKSRGWSRFEPATSARAAASAWSSAASSAAANSTRSAAALGSSVLQYSGVPGKAWAAASRAGATMSSTASAPRDTRPGTSATASSIDGSGIHVTETAPGAGSVFITTSPMNARVPSEPTTRRRKISSGV